MQTQVRLIKILKNKFKSKTTHPFKTGDLVHVNEHMFHPDSPLRSLIDVLCVIVDTPARAVLNEPSYPSSDIIIGHIDHDGDFITSGIPSQAIVLADEVLTADKSLLLNVYSDFSIKNSFNIGDIIEYKHGMRDSEDIEYGEPLIITELCTSPFFTTSCGKLDLVASLVKVTGEMMPPQLIQIHIDSRRFKKINLL